MRRRVRGATLVELLIGIVVSSIVAGALLRMVVGDLRFAEDREAWRTARQAARSGLVVLASDLRMIETGGGVESAAASGQDLSLRVPYAFGVLCTTSGSSSIVSLIPVDSAMFVQPGTSGFAWLDETTGSYTYVPGGSPGAAGSWPGPAGAGTTVLPGSRIVTLSGSVPAGLAAGTIIFLYRRVRYQVKASVAMPGQTALWRTLQTGNRSEEIGAPFAPSARFRFYAGDGPSAQSAVPSPLSTITGLELTFGGRSDRTPRGEAGPKVVSFTTSIYFHNRMP